jgi:hypothetical protein
MTNNNYLTIFIHLSGKYDPKEFFRHYDCPYNVIQEINTIAKSGRNKGKLSDESFCFLEIGDPIEHNKKIKKAVALALKIKNKAKAKHIKINYFCFTLLYEGIQGNMELSKNELKWLNKLDSGICMKYIQNESEDNNNSCYAGVPKLKKFNHELHEKHEQKHEFPGRAVLFRKSL